MPRPSLLLLMAGASALTVIANAAALTAPQQAAAPKTRLGNAIEQDLKTNEAAAARRKRALDLREQTAKAAEARLQAELEARQKETAAGGEPAEAQFDNLARIYQAMKPAKAAMVFEQLDMEVQMKVAQRMRERSTAMILAAMTPKGAAALSMALARKSARGAAGAAPTAGAGKAR